MTGDVFVVNGELNRLLGQLSRRHMQKSYTELTKIDVTQGQPRILRYLKSHNGCIQREICDGCHMKPATVTEVLEKMEDRKLIERKAEPGSRRNLQVFITPLGHTTLTKIDSVDRLIEDKCFHGFTAAEKEQAAHCLDRIYRNLLNSNEE